jgi:hypothetical protein
MLVACAGFYRKHFALPAEWKGNAVWIRFEGVFRATKIWLNGEAVREHAGWAGDAHGGAQNRPSLFPSPLSVPSFRMSACQCLCPKPVLAKSSVFLMDTEKHNVVFCRGRGHWDGWRLHFLRCAHRQRNECQIRHG